MAADSPEPRPSEPRASELTPAERLALPLESLRGVGYDRAVLLRKLRLRTVRDLLYFFPRSYQDYRNLADIAKLQPDMVQSVRGTVAEIAERTTQRGARILGVLITQGDQALRAMWFNQPFLRKKFKVGQELILSGKPKMNGLRWELPHPQIQWLDSEETTPIGRILPVYRLTEGLTQGQMRYMTRNALDFAGGDVDEVFPPEDLAKYQLQGIVEALPEMHYPTSPESNPVARRRFVFQELFILQLGLALRRLAMVVQYHAPPLEATARIDARIKRLFPFELTGDQLNAIREITADMARTVPMNRLLQGDVGSGKTIVALYAILLTVAHGHQAALMAPTEVLARQHFRTLGKMLQQSQVRVALLTGSLSARERENLLKGIRSGEVQVVLGTQSILGEAVEFAKLGLVVIDEQHKFGVRQRSGLKQAGDNPHYLVMTATPIPRTVSMTLYGDLDVSTIKESPPGRQKLYTYLGVKEKRSQWWEFVRKKLREGRQAYVVVPLVEESENWDAASLDRVFDELATSELRGFRLGILHGRMPPEQKESAMVAFANGETQVLISTSVVEVGIDVANATVMTVFDAERFGLAQLHQLRGRVHRGKFPGYCCLFPSKPELSNDALERLAAIVKSTDGFELAEVDFQLRGPGDLFGTKQHGLPPLRIADLQRDRELVVEARAAAQVCSQTDPGLQKPEHEKLRRMVMVRYGKALDLGDVG